MSKKHLAAVAVAAAAVLVAPASAAAASTTAASATAGPAQELKLRKGLTLYIPLKWVVHRVGADRIKVVTGPCANPRGGFFAPGCKSFWIFGPKAIRTGAEGFGPYDAGRGGYYPASDVQKCPKNGMLLRGERVGAHKKGLRQVGPGHKAHYHEFTTRCRTGNGKKTSVTFTTREWYLPKSQILVVDEWSTGNLADTLKYADWK
ncbi:hypothetical protein AB0K05_30455 [Nonomuraea sp. NPDC049486]|uniref:hypothetical protein n=1 Tax=unclassified Nonomuraea TaxID=2593643 RepID=UPI003412ABD8